MKRDTCPIIAVTIAILLLAGSVAFGKAAKVWTTTGAGTYSDGELENVAVLSTGELQLAPAVEPIEGISADYVWDARSDGEATTYVATGAPGALYKLKTGSKAELLHKTIEPHAMSVLPMPDGSVLLGTAPRGIIWRVQPDGSAAVFADLDEAYVWGMTAGPGGSIYCATGPNGRLLKVNAQGEVQELTRVQQSNLMCLAVDADGGIYFGTQPEGFIYRYADGNTKAVYDAEEDEIHALFLEGESVYFCTAQGATNGNGGQSSGPGAPSGAATVPPDPRAGRYSNAPNAANSVYVLDKDRGAIRLVQTQGKFFLSLARDHMGAAGKPVLLAGTGPGGRVLSATREGLVKVLASVEAAQVTEIVHLPDDPGMLLATSNPGGLAFMRGNPAEKGTYTSKPFDAGYLARWGRIWWHETAPEGTDVRVRLRTGVTAQPDAHWSDWTDWTGEATGAALDTSPGQYAQVQVELTTGNQATPAVLDLNVSYKQSNRRPVVQAFNINGMSLLPPPNGQGGQQQRRQPNQQPGLVMLDWQVTDPNNDNLLVHLHYRGVDEKEWKEIQEDIREQQNLQWDTNRLPAGHYLLRITASDGAVRGPNEALVEQRISVPQVIDNRRPEVVDLQAERNEDGSYTITGTARDDYSRVTNLFYSRNGGDWQDAFPADDMLDSPEEELLLKTEVLPPGEHVFVVTALDEEQNPGSGKIVVNVPAQ